MKTSKGKVVKKQRVVIYGAEGIGKTTLANKFPKPIFFDLENGSNEIEVNERRYDFDSLMELRSELKKVNPAEFETIIIDTVDKLEAMLIAEVCLEGDDKGSKEKITDFGYHKGFLNLKAKFAKFLDELTLLTEYFNIVIIGHSHLKKFECPDEQGAYDRYELKLTKEASPVLKEWADMVLFCNYLTTVVKDAQGKAKASGGQRVIYTSHNTSWDAKNRHGLNEKLPLDYEAIKHIIERPATNSITQVAETPKTEPITQVDDNTKLANKVYEDSKPVKQPVTEQQASQLDPVKQESIKEMNQVQMPQYCKDLKALLDMNNITVERFMSVVYEKGIRPVGEPFENLPKELVETNIMPLWETNVLPLFN